MFTLEIILNNNFRLNSSGPKMFRRGCEVMAKLPPHPNIVRYIKHGRKSGRDFMLLEYIEGANLRMLAIKDSDLLKERLSDVLLEMAEALAHVHQHNYMHLDFKPENLQISRSGALLLCDFDTTLPIPDGSFKMPKKSGTPLYMPPEIVKGWHVDQRADIYSFGVTAYELVTRVKPFEGQTPQEMLRNQLNARYRIRKPRELNANIPVMLEVLLLKCLSYLPDSRYHYMAHVVRDLRKCLGVR